MLSKYFALISPWNISLKLQNPVDTERKLNVHQTFRRRHERLLNVLYTFNLRPVSTGKVTWKLFHNLFERVFSLDANLHIMGGGWEVLKNNHKKIENFVNRSFLSSYFSYEYAIKSWQFMFTVNHTIAKCKTTFFAIDKVF